MENEFIKYLRDALFPSVKKTGDAETDRKIAVSTFLDSLGRLLGGIQVQNAGFEDDAAMVEQAKIPKAPSFKYRNSVGTETWTDENGQTVNGIRDPQALPKIKEFKPIPQLDASGVQRLEDRLEEKNIFVPMPRRKL